jgi:hypothetical protein
VAQNVGFILPQTVFVAEFVKPNIFFKKALNYIPTLADKNTC